MATVKVYPSTIHRGEIGAVTYRPEKITIPATRVPSGFIRVKHPFWEGVGSILNVGGKHNAFRKYTKGNIISDMEEDWRMVGVSVRESMNSFKKSR